MSVIVAPLTGNRNRELRLNRGPVKPSTLSLDNFYALFARDRRIGGWKSGPTGGFYPNILDPNDSAITPILDFIEVPLGLSDIYNVAGVVSALGSDYFRFELDSDENGETFSFTLTGAAGGNYSFYMIWEKSGHWKRAAFPPSNHNTYSFSEAVNLAEADTLVLAISGRGTGGACTLNALVV